MERVFGAFYEDDRYAGPPLPDNTSLLREHGIVGEHSEEARLKGREFEERLGAGEHLLLIGLNIGHNSGIALLEASHRDGIVVHANFEEERFTAIKHFAGYPEHSVTQLGALLEKMGRAPQDIFCLLYAWDSVQEEQYGLRMNMFRDKIIKNQYYAHVSSAAAPQLDKIKISSGKRKNIYSHSPSLIDVVRRLNAQLGRADDLLCIQALHHDNHVYYAYGVSPFFDAGNRQKITMISCIDGAGDASSTSLYQAVGGRIDLIKRLPRENSLGVFYMLCSSFLGGWSPLSSEGRYMGAAAWGNGDRLTNPYYKRLRQFFYFGAAGEVFVNSAMTQHEYRDLQDIVGPFLKVEDLWNPDAVLNVDNVKHAKVTQERVDKAAAVQMVFEDALFHIIAHLIAATGSDQLVLCGGTALNCVANMRLLQHFDRNYFQRYLGQDTQLHIWVPPIPSDQGVVVGAAFQFAMKHGAEPRRMRTAFLCGLAPTASQIEVALGGVDYLRTDRLGNIKDTQTRQSVADWMAYLVAQNAVIGIFQGEAETGPRALGHRSLLSNPCNIDTLGILNDRVKLRERIRPLAPMVTLESAAKWFELSAGASDADYDAYNYMVLTAPASSEARKTIPAVVHHDGTSRIQIVRRDNNALMYDYLKALGRHIGVEVSVNTSLNVGSPIVQTPAQTLEIFKRARGLDGIFMVAEEGEVYMVWAKRGVQMYDSNLPRICASYWRARATDPFKDCFANALSTQDELGVDTACKPTAGEDHSPCPPSILTGPLGSRVELISISSAGTGTPWIGVHGLTGDVGDDMPLFRILACDHPVYGFRLDQNSDDERDITALAKRYTQILRRTLPNGPYHLAGYAYGGVLAFEIARLLQDTAAQVDLRLLLVDAPYPVVDEMAVHPSMPGNDALLFAAEALLHHYLGEDVARGGRWSPIVLDEIEADQRIGVLAARLSKQGVPLPLGVIERKLAKKSALCRRLFAAFRQFQPITLKDAVTVRLHLVQSYKLHEHEMQAHADAERWLRQIPKSRLSRIPTDNARHSLFSTLAQSRLQNTLSNDGAASRT